MRLKYCIDANFNVEFKTQINKLVQDINKSFKVMDLPNDGVFFKTIYDLTDLNSLVEGFKKLHFSSDKHESENYFYVSSQLDFEELDKYSAAYISLYGATEYDPNENHVEIINNDLIMEKKTLGNFKNWQVNVLAGDNSNFGKYYLLVKKKFIHFFEEHELTGVSFKPVQVKSLTGEIKPSRSVYWAIFDQEFCEGKNVFREHLWDKFKQPIPKSINPNFIQKIEGLDIFCDNDGGVFITQNMFRLLEENDLLLDLDGPYYWDVGYYGGEASSKLKQQLIEQGRFDEAFEE